MRRSPAVVDRRSIALNVWDNEADALGSNTIDVHMARLRVQAGRRARCASSRCAPSDTGSWPGELAPPRSAAWPLPAAGRGHAARVALVATLLVGVVYVGCVIVLDRAITGAAGGRGRHPAARAPDRELAGHRADQPATGGRQPDGDGLAGDRPGRRRRRGARCSCGGPGPGSAAVPLTDGRPGAARRPGPGRRRPGHGAAGRQPVPAGHGRPGRGPAGGRAEPGRAAAHDRRAAGRRGGGGAGAAAGHVRRVADHRAARAVPGGAVPAPPAGVHRGRLARAAHPAQRDQRGDRHRAERARGRPTDYRAALQRIEGESQRLRRIVEDLLWLARFDSQPPPPGAEPLDLGTIAAECADRFQAVAHSRVAGHLGDRSARRPRRGSARRRSGSTGSTGVLVDNACRYAGPGGTRPAQRGRPRAAGSA